MNHVFYDKEKYISKNIMENFPSDVKYDENDCIEVVKLSKSRFDKNGKFTYEGEKEVIDILFRIKK